MTTASSASLQIAQNGQNIQPLEKSVHLSIIHTTKISSHWKKQDSQQLLKRPNHPSGGKISTFRHHSHDQNIQPLEENTRPIDLHTTKSSTHWRNSSLSACSRSQNIHRLEKSPVQQTSIRPNHPATGGKHPLSNPAHDQNIQPLEKSVRLVTYQTAKSSTHWRNTDTQTPLTRPNHPPTGRKHPLNRPPYDQNIQPLEKSVRLSTTQTAKSSSHWRNRAPRKATAEDLGVRRRFHARNTKLLTTNCGFPHTAI